VWFIDLKFLGVRRKTLNGLFLRQLIYTSDLLQDVFLERILLVILLQRQVLQMLYICLP